MIKPDYKCNSSVSGCTSDSEEKAEQVYDTDCCWKWPRWFDDKRRKRKIEITIEKYYGNYHHWYVELEEEENPFWLPPDKKNKSGTWVHDSKARGRNFSERFNTKEGAETYVDLIMRDHFPNHRPVIKDMCLTTKTWHYCREGD